MKKGTTRSTVSIERYYETVRKTHSIVVTGTPRSGILNPYIGKVFPTLRALAIELKVTPRTASYWLSMGYVNKIKNLPKTQD